LGNGFREIVEIAPRRRCGLVGTSLLAIGASGAALLSELSGRLTAVALLLALLGVLARLRARRARTPLTRAMLLPDGRWQLCFGSAPAVPARLTSAWGESLGPLIALEWVSQDGTRHSTWLLARELHDAVRRRLRARLRLS
jgi:hypothetical protein